MLSIKKTFKKVDNNMVLHTIRCKTINRVRKFQITLYIGNNEQQ